MIDKTKYIDEGRYLIYLRGTKYALKNDWYLGVVLSSSTEMIHGFKLKYGGPNNQAMSIQSLSNGDKYIRLSSNLEDCELEITNEPDYSFLFSKDGSIKHTLTGKYLNVTDSPPPVKTKQISKLYNTPEDKFEFLKVAKPYDSNVASLYNAHTKYTRDQDAVEKYFKEDEPLCAVSTCQHNVNKGMDACNYARLPDGTYTNRYDWMMQAERHTNCDITDSFTPVASGYIYCTKTKWPIANKQACTIGVKAYRYDYTETSISEDDWAYQVPVRSKNTALNCKLAMSSKCYTNYNLTAYNPDLDWTQEGYNQAEVWGPFTKSTAKVPETAVFCAQHDTESGKPYWITKTACKQWSIDNPSEFLKAQEYYCDTVPGSLHCVRACQDAIAKDNSAAKVCSDLAKVCKGNMLETDVCRQYCNLDGVNCDMELENYCIPFGKTKKLSDIPDVCGCFLGTDYFANYFRGLSNNFMDDDGKPLNTSGQAALPQCYFPRCSTAPIKPFNKTNCPNQVVCVQAVDVDINGTVLGDFTINQDSNCTMKLNPEVCKANEYVKGSKCVTCPSGEVPNVAKSACEKCPSGKSKDGVCEPCPSNKVLVNNQCVSCRSDQVIVNGECKKCPTGFVARNGDCVQCNSDEIIDGNTCVKCNAPNVVQDGKCKPCTSLQKYDPETKSCVYNPKRCPESYRLDPSGHCVYCDGVVDLQNNCIYTRTNYGTYGTFATGGILIIILIIIVFFIFRKSK